MAREATRQELIDGLRQLADRLEASGIPDGVRAEMKLSFYNVSARPVLAAIARIMGEPRADKNGGTHWLKSEENGTLLGITAFYKPGLLGRLRKKKTVVVESESRPDIAGLLAAN